jgi:hypothetical protein
LSISLVLGLWLSFSATVTAAPADVLCYRDADGDGYGNPAVSQDFPGGCAAGWVLDNTDCNDNNIAINPGAAEVCNGVDDNCVSGADEGFVCYTVYYCDADGDGYYSPTVSGSCNFYQCVPAGCQTGVGNDCDDDNFDVHPGATELCNGIDDNCVGGIDDGGVCQTDYYCDADEDGHFSGVVSGDCNSYQCIPAGCRASPAGDDCNDGNPDVNPDEDEVCNGIDDNCAAGVDEGGDALCDDGLFCTGFETCLGAGGCLDGEPTCTTDNVCLLVTCDEDNDQCLYDKTANNGDPCEDGEFCTVDDSCDDGDCIGGGPRDCDDGMPCSFDTCDSDNEQCVTDIEECAELLVAPSCLGVDPHEMFEIRVLAEAIDGEDAVGFTLTFNGVFYACQGYTLVGGVLEEWAATFDCAVQTDDDAVECYGESDTGAAAASNALLVTFYFAPQEAGLTAEQTVFATTALQGDLQFMTPGECAVEFDDDDDNDDTSPVDDDTSPADDDTSPDDDDDDDNDTSADDDDDDTSPDETPGDDDNDDSGDSGCGC